MKKTKIALFAMLMITFMLALTGCSKTAITADDFKAVSESHGLEIVDVTEQYAGYETFQSATVAMNSDGWQIEFMVLTDERAAIGSFNANKEYFEDFKGNMSSETSTAIGNSASYTLTSAGYYMHVCRIDNTMVYVNVPADYKDAVKAVLDELGY